VILAGNSLSANEVGGPPVRVPVVLMCALLVTACLALARPVPAPLRANS
jgi:hypothetical protein